MKHLKITVNGTAYDVQVEELDSASAPAASPAPAAPAAAPASKPAQEEDPFDGIFKIFNQK